MANLKPHAPLLVMLATSVGCYVGVPDGAVDAGTDGFADDGDNDDDDDDDGPADDDDEGGSGDDPSSPDDDDGATSPSGDAGDASDTDAGVSATAGDESTGSDVDPPPDSELARDIAWSSVEMNQGVVIEVVRDGAYLSSTQRNADLIAGRPTLVRGFWTLGTGFAPRQLDGRLIVRNGADEQVFSNVRSVNGPPDTSDLDGGFKWEIPTGVIQGTSEFAFEITETDGGAPGAAPEAGARIPSDGFEPSAVASGAHTLEVVIVPLRYVAGGNLTPDLSESSKTVLENALYDQNPVTELEISYRASVDYGAAVTNGNQLGDILGFLSNLKSQDGAGPEVYYTGLINVGCFVVGCGNAGTTGVGYIPPASQNSSFQRVNINVWFNPESSSGTVVHEVGHNQGLSHVACPGGGAAGTDPNYPYANGQLSGWGWGPKSKSIFGSSTYDYMSYCGPSWVSDWTWQKTEARIETLSSWAGAAPALDVPLVLGHVYPDGSQSWFHLRGPRPSLDTSSASTITFGLADQSSVTTTAKRGELSDGLGQWVVAEVPSSGDGFEQLVWRHDGVVDTIARERLR